MKNVLILGGTGRMGSALVEKLASRCNNITTLSRRAASGQHIQADINSFDDYNGFDTVIHCAAMKDVVKCEQQIEQCISTNITATAYALRAAQRCGVSKYIYISTDMAVEPESVYGASKKIADAMVVDAAKSGEMQTAVVRFGNIITREGSILTVLANRAAELGYVPVTDAAMTRFMMSAPDCSDFVIDVASKEHLGGIIFVPRCQSYRILDVAAAVAPQAPVRIVGLRPGDALTIKIISSSEAVRTVEYDRHFEIMPKWSDKLPVVGYRELTSANNDSFATVEQLRELYDTLLA